MQYFLESSHTSLRTNDPNLLGTIASILAEQGESVKIFTDQPKEVSESSVKRVYRKAGRRPGWQREEVFFILDHINETNYWLAKQDVLKRHTLKAIAAVSYKLRNPKFATANLLELKNEWGAQPRTN